MTLVLYVNNSGNSINFYNQKECSIFYATKLEETSQPGKTSHKLSELRIRNFSLTFYCKRKVDRCRRKSLLELVQRQSCASYLVFLFSVGRAVAVDTKIL